MSNRILLEDGVSRLLLEDGVSFLEQEFSADVTAGLSGATSACSGGTIGVQRQSALSGLAAPSSGGAVAPSRTVAAAGQSSAASAGAVSASRAVAFGGLASAVSAGSPASWQTAATVGGHAASLVSGTVGAGSVVSLSGHGEGTAAGAVGAGSFASLSGHGSATAAGTVTYEAQVSDVTLSLSGADVLAAAGWCVPSASRGVSGQHVQFTQASLRGVATPPPWASRMCPPAPDALLRVEVVLLDLVICHSASSEYKLQFSPHGSPAGSPSL